MGKAKLTFPIKTATSDSTTYDVSVFSYAIGYQTQLGSAAVRYQRHSYPIRIKEQDIPITIQCRSVAQFDDIKKSIRLAQVLALASISKATIRFSYPDLGLDYLGFIPNVSDGVRRFEAAPKLSFIFSLFKDTINTVTDQYSTVNGTWKDIAGTDLANEINPQDFILKSFTPKGFIPRGGTRPVF
jgi:hypothetical protein